MITFRNLLLQPDPKESGWEECSRDMQPSGDGASPVSNKLVADEIASSTQVSLKGAHRASWEPADFAQKQIQGLIQQVFFPGWPRPSRQVVFSAVDHSTECAGVCARVARVMARELPGTVCAIEANPGNPGLQREMKALASAFKFDIQHVTANHKEATPIAGNLWLLGADFFLGRQTAPLPAGWLRSRLGELRQEFDYTVIHAPPAGYSSETAVLGQLSDGIILVLEAHKTRRVVARRAKENLQAANVRLLGCVLDQRTFPIPGVVYRNL
jgi:Mrp family chromosome partitioning ATPase